MNRQSWTRELKQRILLNSHDHTGHRAPSRSSVLRLTARLFAEKVARIYQKPLFLDQWYLMFDLDEDMSMSFREFKEVIPPKDRFWADPHVIQTDGHYFIFVEEYIFKNGKAHVSVIHRLT